MYLKIMTDLNSVILLGDSIFCRLLSKYPGYFSELSSIFCISGQFIHELKLKIKANRNLVRGKIVVVLIGTNDLKDRVDLNHINQSVKTLLRLLRNLGCRIYIVETLPIARWGLTAESQTSIRKYCEFLYSCHTLGVKLIKVFDTFFVNGEVDLSLYCNYYPSGRVDRIHPNSEGLSLLLSVIVNTLT